MKYCPPARGVSTCLFFAIQLLTGVAGADVKPKVMFIASDDNKPVEGNVYYLANHTKIGRSNSGTAILDPVPKQGDQLYLAPDTFEYVFTPFRWAPPGSTVVVNRRPHSVSVKALLKGLAKATDESDQATVALIANELSTKFEMKHESKSVYKQVSYLAAAQAFELPLEEALTYDPEQRKTVPSEKLTMVVRQYQKDNGLSVTGDLNYATLHAKARTSIGDVITTFSGTEAGNAATVDFVEAMRRLDRDPALQDKKTEVYTAILDEANLTGTVEPDANSMLNFFQATANDEQRNILTNAVNKHLPPL